MNRTPVAVPLAVAAALTVAGAPAAAQQVADSAFMPLAAHNLRLLVNPLRWLAAAGGSS